MVEQFDQALRLASARVVESVGNFLPGVLVFLILLVGALAVALVVRYGLRRALNSLDFDRRSELLGVSLADWTPSRSASAFVASVAYWTILVVGLLLGLTLGAQVILGNAYHLHFRPGEDVIEDLGGLHGFSGWDGPILTDSGGFQVFSLRDTILALDEEGVTFRSVYDGSAERFTPEGVAEIQRRLGSDIAMCLDVCLPAGADRAELERAVALTTRWAQA